MIPVPGVGGVGPSEAMIWAVDPADPGETTPPRVHLCRHCLKVLSGTVKATYNGAPLCLGSEDEPRCYRLVSAFHHEMPCHEDPCPGEVMMTHDHEGE